MVIRERNVHYLQRHQSSSQKKAKTGAGRLYLPTVSQKEGGEHRDLGPELFRGTAPAEGVEPELKPRHSVGVDQRLAAHKSEQKTTFQATAGTSIQDPDPDPLDMYVFGTPGSASGPIIYLYRYGSGSFHQQAKKLRKT
jgi:hypothetical protein